MAKIFMSYSHADEALRDQLEKQLVMLRREGVIETWHDRRIPPGDNLDRAIDAELQSADVVLLLVSPDFLASRYCFEVEMAAAMERHHAGEARVIPVILRACDWQSSAAPFRNLKAIPRDGKPIMQWADRDEAMLDVVQGIRQAMPPPSAPAVAPSPKAAKVVDRPRSSNLRVAKEFTQADRDRFLDEAFDYMARFFENSLSELDQRNEEIETRFRRIDANAFGCVVYRRGKVVARCGVRRGAGFSNGIAYSQDDNAPSNSMNEELTPGADEQSMWLQPMGMQMRSGFDRHSKLTAQGASEYYWELLMQPLQRER
jgi:hypothetical protein